ncbi:helix-turn-helix domain-containing protein [uncultured Methanobrevibacter sp.]|uniref:AlbA family DNA-binding domain-containing protein n=1 Tax=uncultured Methanobrevibacter sp. TaxID=253161 RepID=UPI0025FA3DD1|nr:ATP-binding protein [uncultured Methanobrevibacter sp.]
MKSIKENFAKLFDDPNRVTLKDSLMNLTTEYDDFEFKEIEIETHILAKHIIGMANTNGGIIILGVKDTENGLKPCGLESTRDITDMKKQLAKYLPHELTYDIHQIDYDERGEWGDLKNKSFKIIKIVFTSEYIPFLPIKGSENYEKTDIFCRKNSSTTRCEYDDLQDIFNKRKRINRYRISALTLRNELEELKILSSYNTVFNQALSFTNPSFLDTVKDLERRKIKYIEQGLKIEDID